jgi:hypothetical protein
VVLKEKLQKLKIKRERIIFYKDISLMLAMFFLPLGYDALFKFIMDITESYWMADITFYSISGCFWLCYILLTKYLNNKL